MSQPETSDQAATGGNDIFAIPIDHASARSYFLAMYCIVAFAAAIIPVGFFLMIFLMSFFFAHNGLIFVFAVAFCSFGFLFLVTLGYFFFAKWLIEQQVKALNYRIEGRTLRVDSGVFFLKRKGVPLDRITDFALVQGPLMRLLGIWALHVQTAGVGTPMPEATLFAIETPEQVRDELLRRRDEAARGNR